MILILIYKKYVRVDCIISIHCFAAFWFIKEDIEFTDNGQIRSICRPSSDLSNLQWLERKYGVTNPHLINQ